ncbi:site-specific integrase [Aliarcobacter butzleri]|nr:site-specific integrase [Aliarcobacter butzleri]
MLDNLKEKRDKLIFKFMFFTGARIGETLSLKIQNLNTFNAIKKIQIIELTNEIENESIRRRLKTGIRKLFIPNWLYNELNEYYNTTWSKTWDKLEFEHNYLFISQGNRNYGFPLSYSSINNKFKEISKKIGINFTPHDLRHTFATNLARNKVDISSIQKLLGHKNPSTCSIYIQLAKEEDIAKELEILYDKLEGEENA